MTDEELKKYREQIERLKRDFHGEDLDKIENRDIADKAIKPAQQPAEGSLLSELKGLNNYFNKPEITKTDEIKTNSEEIKTVENNIEFDEIFEANQNSEIINEVKEIINEVNENNLEILSNKETNQENIRNYEEPKIEKVIIEFAEPKIRNVSNDIIPPVIPPSNSNNELDDEKKSSILKYILMLLGLILLGFVAYYFYNKNRLDTVKNETEIKNEKLYSDSVLAYEEALKVQKEIEEKYAEENKVILISDTIFNLTDTANFAGYYAVIGSFAEKKNANKTKRKNKTSFDAIILNEENTDKLRLGLKISDNENQVLQDLEDVRKIYPQAWLLYNKN